MKLWKSLFAASALLLVVPACDVDQTREGELPDMDVDVEGDPGQMPAYDVEGPEVDVEQEKTDVTVPDIDMEEKEITTPDVDVDLPE